MKKRNKLWSLLLAGTMMGATVMPVAAPVYATEATSLEGVKIKAQDVTTALEKGDTFNIFITLDPTMSGDELRDKLQYVDLTGAVEDSFRPDEITINGDGGIVIQDVVYNGNGNQVGIELVYEGLGANQGPSTSMTLENAQSSQQASAGLDVSKSVVNVVTGERQQITFTLVNNGDAVTSRGEMTFELADKKGSEGIEIKTKEVSIPEMKKGESRDFTFTADIDENVTRGIHKINVEITDENDDNAVTKTLQLKVDSDFMPPSLQIAASNTTGFELNQPQDISINLKNVGHVGAKNVKVEVTPNESVIVADGSNVRYINAIESGQTESVDMMLQVISDKSVTIPLQLKLTYIDDLGEERTDSQTLYINTQSTGFAKEITVRNIKEPTGIYGVGENFGIGFDVYAEDGAKNMTISVKGAEGIVPKTKNMFVVNAIEAGGTESFYVDFIASDQVATGTHLIEIEAKYQLNNEETVISQFATVSIDNPDAVEEDEELKGKPKVIIGNYSSEPMVVKAGQEFELNLGFLNTNNTKSVHNLKANLTVRDEGENNTGNVFTPVNASNTFYIESLAPGEMMTENITLYTLPSAAPKTYEITIEMEYEDAQGNAITATEKFGIPVEQVTKLEVAEVYTDVVEVGRESYMTARIYNTGKTDISNVKIQTIGENFEVVDNIMFIGLMEKGAAETYEPTLIPNVGGMLQGQLQIEYEDVTGVVQTMIHDFEMEVIEQPTFPEGDFFPEEGMEPEIEVPVEEEASFPWPVMGGVAIGALIAAGITAFVAKRRKRKQDEFGFDED